MAHETAKNLRLPQAEVVDASVAHAGPAAQLILTTIQIGSLTLLMSDDVLQKVRQEIGRVVTYRSGPQTKQ